MLSLLDVVRPFSGRLLTPSLAVIPAPLVPYSKRPSVLLYLSMCPAHCHSIATRYVSQYRLLEKLDLARESQFTLGTYWFFSFISLKFSSFPYLAKILRTSSVFIPISLLGTGGNSLNVSTH